MSKRVLLGLALDFGGLLRAGFSLAEAEGVVGSTSRLVGVVFVVVRVFGVDFLSTGAPARRTEGLVAAGEAWSGWNSLGGREGSGVM